MTSRLFYQTRLERPQLDRAEGIYMWDTHWQALHRRVVGRDGQQYRPFQPARSGRDARTDGKVDLRLPAAFPDRGLRGAGGNVPQRLPPKA